MNGTRFFIFLHLVHGHNHPNSVSHKPLSTKPPDGVQFLNHPTFIAMTVAAPTPGMFNKAGSVGRSFTPISSLVGHKARAGTVESAFVAW